MPRFLGIKGIIEDLTYSILVLFKTLKVIDISILSSWWSQERIIVSVFIPNSDCLGPCFYNALILPRKPDIVKNFM